ncbi:transglycosylase family protein [Streptomyces sp. NPDC058734]|uniref:transglycosylase family protein n=1 Tax=Streptomyces sp. NPDC058734 TaxID=3346615 RepID=UPI0036AA4CD2
MSARRRLTALASVTATVAVSSSVLLSLGAVPASAAGVATWDKVAQCESSGNWSINTGNGYYGGLQFSASTWRAYGGTAYAAYAHQATKKQQILIGEKVLAGQGPGAWPTCGRLAGLGSDHADPYPDAPTPPAPTGQWRAQVAVESGGGLYHAVRNADRTWTGFGDVQGVTGAVPGGVRTTAEAGINGDTHVLAVTNEGKLYHSIRFADRSWSDFGDVAGEAGQLANITQVAAVSSGTEVQVVVVADGKVFHTVRRANGTWAPFGAVGNPGGAPVTKVALSQTGTDTQVVAVSNGTLFHTVRHADGTWTNWGNASAETGVSGIEEVAVAGTGGDLQLIVTTEGGAKRYHGARFAGGQWVLNDLSAVVPTGVTVTDVAAAQVNNELQAAFVTTDGRVLHTIRAVNGTWTPAAPVDLAGVPGTRTGVSITGTYN